MGLHDRGIDEEKNKNARRWKRWRVRSKRIRISGLCGGWIRRGRCRHWRERRCRRGAVLDTETTGMDLAADQVIELALVAFEYDEGTGAIGRVLGTYSGLEDPGGRFASVHGHSPHY